MSFSFTSLSNVTPKIDSYGVSPRRARIWNAKKKAKRDGIKEDRGAQSTCCVLFIRKRADVADEEEVVRDGPFPARS